MGQVLDIQDGFNRGTNRERYISKEMRSLNKIGSENTDSEVTRGKKGLKVRKIGRMELSIVIKHYEFYK